MDDCTHAIPLKNALDGYVTNRFEVGGFLTALLTNNLVEAFGRADGFNRPLMGEYVEHLYWCVPAPAWGSPEKVAAWLRREEADR